MTTSPPELFHQIAEEVPNASEGKMFGAACIKASNGKAAAIFWKDEMIFKLNEEDQKQALALEGTRIGAHLYAPDRPMKGWVVIPTQHSDQWKHFALRSIHHLLS